MSAYVQNLFTALRTRINVVWTDVTAHGIYEAEHASLVPWDRLKDKLPFAVIAIHRLRSADWGADNQAYIADVDLWYVGAVTGPTGTILTRLEALRDDLWANELTTGQLLPEPGMSLDWSQELEPNQLFAQQDAFVRAGRLSVAILVGEGP